jgi:hypothetical protein
MARRRDEPSAIGYLVERCATDACLQEVTRHTLRRAPGKNLVGARVAGPLGCESVDTSRIYTTPSQQPLQREVEQMAVAWTGARSKAGSPASVSISN